MSNKSKKAMRRAAKSNTARNNSAGDSSCSSSQELSLDERQPSHSKYLDACPTSQETYCSDIERIVETQTKPKNNLTIFESNYPNSQESIYPNSEEFSQTSTNNLIENGSANGLTLIKSDSGFASEMSPQSSEDPSIKPHEDYEIVSLNDNHNDGKERIAKKRKANSISDLTDDDDDDVLLKNFLQKKQKLSENEDDNGMCVICLTEPKNGAFVHNRFLHVCCCYRCTVKVWNKRKQCPLCNSQVRTVLKIFVH